jgi:GMP synthase (glutamine-hydrolysing)
MTKVWAVQHVRCETLGTLGDVLQAKGISFEYIRTFEGEPISTEIKDASGLIVLGGPMAVYEQDRYPFLRQEIRLIEEALKENKPVLGICLGSQLLAAALGAKVTKGKLKEIGWYPVRLKEAAVNDPLWAGREPSFTAYHWHGDVFDLPFGAVSLASSDLTEHQAFRHGRNAYGFLFHMETTEKIIREMVETFRNELKEAGIDGQRIIEQTGDHLPRLQGIGKSVFERWTDRVKAGVKG